MLHARPVSIEMVDQLSSKLPDEKSSKTFACARTPMSNPSPTMAVLIIFFILNLLFKHNKTVRYCLSDKATFAR